MGWRKLALFGGVLLMGVGLVLWIYRSSPDRVAFVDVEEIVRKGSYFRTAKKEWTRDRRRLRKEYLQQLRRLEGRSRLVASLISNGSSSLRKSGSTEESIHQHGRKRPDQEDPGSKGSGVLRTIMTRKLRAEKLMQRKQKEINREGHRRIREAVKRVAERRGIERVYEKGDLLYKRGQSAENTGFMTESRDITGAVLRELSSDS